VIFDTMSRGMRKLYVFAVSDFIVELIEKTADCQLNHRPTAPRLLAYRLPGMAPVIGSKSTPSESLVYVSIWPQSPPASSPTIVAPTTHASPPA
jgi:hypothetical protein